MGKDRSALSPRLAAVLDALPLRPGLRVVEIGCGPGTLARAIASRIGEGHVLAVDRSGAAVAQAKRLGAAEMAAGRLSVRQAAAETFALEPGEPLYDVAVAIRVGAFDGRHPDAGRLALPRIAAALVPGGRLFVDAGDALIALPLDQ